MTTEENLTKQEVKKLLKLLLKFRQTTKDWGLQCTLPDTDYLSPAETKIVALVEDMVEWYAYDELDMKVLKTEQEKPC